MRHKKAIRKLGKPTAHRKALLRNLVTSLFQHEKVITTKAKAKAAQQVAERLIRYSIAGTLEDKRRIFAYLKNREVAHKLVKLGAEKFTDFPRGGQTAVYRLGYRKGDGAEMAVLSLLTEPIEKKKKKRKKKKEKVIEVASESENKAELPFSETPIEENIEEEAVKEIVETSDNMPEKIAKAKTVEEKVGEPMQEPAEPEDYSESEDTARKEEEGIQSNGSKTDDTEK